MKRLLMLQLLAFSLACILGISSASALGIGAYYNQGWGDGEIENDDSYDYDWDWDDDYYDDDYDFEFDTENDYKTRVIGLMLDTNVARDSLFNYRLNIALDEVDIKLENGLKDKADGYVMDHTFGFGVLRNQNVRLWIGPQINLSYYDEDDFERFGLGIGPAIGINIHAGDKVSFTVASGYKFNFLFGEIFDNDFTGYEGQYYINFGVLFRINDIYQQ